MSYENWKDKAQGFQTMDVRHIQGSFFEGLKKRAEALEVGEGLHIITGCFVFSASRRQAALVVLEKPASAAKPLRWRSFRIN